MFTIHHAFALAPEGQIGDRRGALLPCSSLAKWIVSWIVSDSQSFKCFILKGGSSSVVERQLPKLNVAGSIPVSRSIYPVHRYMSLSRIGGFGDVRRYVRKVLLISFTPRLSRLRRRSRNVPPSI